MAKNTSKTTTGTTIPKKKTSNAAPDISGELTGTILSDTSGGSDPYFSGSTSLNVPMSGLLGLSGTPTAAEILNKFTSLASTSASSSDRAQIAQLQHQLYLAGAYGNNIPVFGTINQTDLAAFIDAVQTAGATKSDLGTYIKARANQSVAMGISPRQPIVAGGITGGGGLYTIDLDNPESIKKTADQIAMAVLGRGVSDPAEQARLVAHVQNIERSSQEKVNRAREQVQRQQFDQQVSADQQGALMKSGALGAVGATGGVATGADMKPAPGALDTAQIAQVAYNAGFRGEALATAVAVALAESHGRPAAHNPNAATGDDSYGMWQVNYYAGLRADRTAKYGAPERQFDPQHNANTAFKISGGGKNFKPWTTFAKGNYKQYMAAAQQAAANVESRATTPSEKRAPQYGREDNFVVRNERDVAAARVAGPIDTSIPNVNEVQTIPNVYTPATTVTNVAVDPQAEVEAKLRREHPTEAAAHDWIGQYNVLLNFLRTGSST